MWCLPARTTPSRSLTFVLVEQPELRGIARGLRQAEMAEGVAGKQTAARRTLQETLLDQERLNDVLDRVARLTERGRHRVHTNGSAAVAQRDGREVAAIHCVETCAIDLQFT